MRRGWLATVVGSGILLILIVVFAVTTAREAKRIYSELSKNDQAIQDLEIQLSGLRSDIFRSGIYVRDQLLDSQSAIADDQREKLHEVHDAMEERLQKIAELVPNEQAAKIEELRLEIAGYWAFVSPVAEDPVGVTLKGYDAVREQLVGRRDSSLAIAREIGRLNRNTYQERHDRIALAENAFLNYIWTMMAFTLVLGVVVFLSSSYIVRVLHRRTERHRDGSERAERELRLLSTDLFLTQENERRVLSRELHDEVGQTLTALGMELGNLEALGLGSSPPLKEHLAEAKRLTQRTLKTVRDLAMGLRPAMLDDSGLVPAVRYQAREFSRHSGIPVTVDIHGNLDELPEAHRTCVYRVIQEALTNCARHAFAKTVRISVYGHHESISLEVEDDGVGLKDMPHSGLGLIGISERARELKGHVEMLPGLCSGTLLRVELPLLGNATS